jgi:hypothetical protein
VGSLRLSWVVGRITTQPPQLTVDQLLFVVAALSVGLADLNGNQIWFSGLSMMTSIGLLIAAVGAAPDAGRTGPSRHF